MTSNKWPTTRDGWRELRVTVMGLGRFGGGVAVAKFLMEHGAKVTITDLLPEEELTESLKALAPHQPHQFVLGKHDERDFQRTDVLIVNPAVKPGNRFVKVAQHAGVPITSEIEIFWRLCPAKQIAVTGSNGKSTTAGLIAALLRSAGITAFLGGNIGHSLLPEIDSVTAEDWAVLELSSFQLARLESLKPTPEVAVVTNFSPNHLDWHETLAEYRHAKQNLLRWQTPKNAAVLNQDDLDVRSWPTQARQFGFGSSLSELPGVYREKLVWRSSIEHPEEIPLEDWLCIPGEHNHCNAAAAIAAVSAAGEITGKAEQDWLTRENIRDAFTNFSGLPHRLEFVRDIAGRRFFNDSISTTPESTIAAVRAFSEPVIVIIGGSDKGSDFSVMIDEIHQHTKAVALIGQTGPRLFDELKDRQYPAESMRVCASLEETVTWAAGQSSPGDVVVLSPGCASYDWFRNFADRGEQFANLVKQLPTDQLKNRL